MNYKGYAILTIIAIWCVAVALVVPVEWVKIVSIGLAILVVLGAWVWMKMHSIRFLQRRITKVMKRRGCECVRRDGEFYIVHDTKRNHLRFLETGWRMTRIMIETRVMIPYYDRLNRRERCLFIGEVNEHYPYVKMVDDGAGVMCSYMCMVEYACDFYNGMEGAEYYFNEMLNAFYSRVLSYADYRGWVKRDKEGNIIDEDEALTEVQKENGEGTDDLKDESQEHKGRTVVKGLFR